MRRSLAEWLLLPLFLLPPTAGAGLCLYARERHRAEVAGFQANGASLVARWLDGGPGREMAREFEERVSALYPCQDSLFEHPDGAAILHLRSEIPETGPRWRLTDEFPAGLSASALADPAVRLEVETGASPVRMEGADSGSRELAALAARPDAARLRRADLPAATKLFLVRRWLRDTPDSPKLRREETALVALRDYQRGLRSAGFPLPPGRHRFGSVEVLSIGEGRDELYTWVPSPRTVAHEVADPPVTVVFEPEEDGPAVAWRGRLDTPLAGEWAIVLRYPSWWTDPRFHRWAGPAAVVLVAFLLLPTALLISIRRRRRLDEARARFINELAHDLRTPLTSLRLYAEMLSAGKVEDDDRDRYVEVMARESARVSALLANLLDLSRLERRERAFEKEWIDLDEAVEGAIRDFTALYPGRGPDVMVSGGDDVGVRGDRTALARCLANLLDNAGKFTAHGTPIRISWQMMDEDSVRLVVADEGRGIPEREKARLFARYARGADAAKSGVPGTGLGLSLVKDLAEGMGGTVRFGKAAKGLAVEIRLPGGVGG